MFRGTTPTHTFTLPFDAACITKLNIAYAQDGKIVLEKHLQDCQIEGNAVSVTLTESETLLFDSDKTWAEIQLRLGCGEKRMASRIMHITTERILKDGCLE